MVGGGYHKRTQMYQHNLQEFMSLQGDIYT